MSYSNGILGFGSNVISGSKGEKGDLGYLELDLNSLQAVIMIWTTKKSITWKL